MDTMLLLPSFGLPAAALGAMTTPEVKSMAPMQIVKPDGNATVTAMSTCDRDPPCDFSPDCYETTHHTKCRPKRDDGAPCIHSKQCYGWCSTSGKCHAKKKEGDTCHHHEDSQCEDDLVCRDDCDDFNCPHCARA